MGDFFFQQNFPRIKEGKTWEMFFLPCHQGTHRPRQYLSLRWGTMTDINVLSIGFLSSILMLIFIQTLLLFKLPHFIYVPSITSLRYNVNHSCATVTALFLPFLQSLWPLPLLFRLFPTMFPVLQCFTVLLFLYLVL